MNTDGSGFSIIKNLGTTTGERPRSGLLESGGELVGATSAAGNFGGGTIFKLSTNGSGFSVIHHLPSGLGGAGFSGNLILSGSTFYGAMRGSLDELSARTFRVSSDGSDFTVLHTNTFPEGISLNSGFVLSGNTLYGTTLGVNVDFSTVFKVNTDGTGYVVLKEFLFNDEFLFTDGSSPTAGLVLSGDTLYGTTFDWGAFVGGSGTVFQINTDGSDFTVLKHFNGSDGGGPTGNLVLDAGVLYGTTAGGGALEVGTVFQLDLRPRLMIRRAGNGVLLSWPAYTTEYRLEQNPGLLPADWSSVDSTPSDDGTTRSVIVTPLDRARFYRLSDH